MIEPGAEAPDFSLSGPGRQDRLAADLRGQTSVLVFYPGDWSPVCTDQLNVYQEVLGELEEQGAKLYGVSVDSAFSHKAFQQHLGITFPLLADFHPKGEVSRQYGAYIEERGHNNRSLVMIGPDLKVVWSHAAPTPLEIPGANLIFDALEQHAAEPERVARQRGGSAAGATTTCAATGSSSSSSTATTSARTARRPTCCWPSCRCGACSATSRSSRSIRARRCWPARPRRPRSRAGSGRCTTRCSATRAGSTRRICGSAAAIWGSTSSGSRPTGARTRSRERVRRDFRSGIRAGVTTTPTLWVDGRPYPGVPDDDLLARLSN